MKHISNADLLTCTETLVAEERKITLALIEHLEEIERRMLYAELGYSSLWDFATRRLGLSEGSAQRRIQAMRLLKAAPEAKAKIADGSLSVTNAARVQSFRQAERKQGRKQDARELVEKVSGQSQKDCEKTLFSISPEAMPQERERIVSGTEDRELKLVLSPALYEKLQRLKGLLAHSKGDTTYAALLEHLADQELARLEKKRGIDATPSPTATAAVKPLPASKRVYLPVGLTRPVWRRAQGQCEYTNQGKRCPSRHRLQIDHIMPLSQGGSNKPENLRLLCWHHNRHAWLNLTEQAS